MQINPSLLVGIVWILILAVGCDCSAKGDQIAKIARSYIDSENWLYTAYHSVGGSNTNKCNLFVADVLKEAGADAPNRWFWKYSPISAADWGNPDSLRLRLNSHWSNANEPYQKGDVISDGHHVGIVTGYKKTTSSSSVENPAGLIVENNWGFRWSSQIKTGWRYEI